MPLTNTKISEAWAGRAELPERLREHTAKELREECWACGTTTTNRRERAHIKPDHQGGDNNDPLNFFLLCPRCHRDQPDCVPRALQLRWLDTAPSEVEYHLEVARSTLRLLRDNGVTLADLEAVVESGINLTAGATTGAAHLQTQHANLAWNVLRNVEDFLASRRRQAAKADWAAMLGD